MPSVLPRGITFQKPASGLAGFTRNWLYTNVLLLELYGYGGFIMIFHKKIA